MRQDRTQTLYDSPIGALTLVAEDDALIGLYFPGHSVGGPPPAQKGESAILTRARRALDLYFAAKPYEIPPLRFYGTPFQMSVWNALLAIEHGRTCSYADIARALGKPAAVRAVGGAVGRNPISILAPCHRVIGTSGALTGFGGGMERKRFLLALEQGVPQLAV